MINISKAVENVCKKLDIKYKSIYHKDIKQSKLDAQKLAKIYLDLKIIINDLEEIKQHYPELEKELNIDIYDLNKTDHHLIIETQKILRTKNNGY